MCPHTDPLQVFRMVLWPILVGVTGYNLTRLVLMFLNDRCYLSRTDHVVAISAGTTTFLLGVGVSLLWNNCNKIWWILFTIGLLVMTTVSLITAILQATSDTGPSDRSSGPRTRS